MDIKTAKRPLNRFVQNISKTVKVNQVIIFGSYLEGNATEDSDIDVVIVSDDFKKVRQDRRIKILDTAAKGINPEIQAWGFTNEELNRADELTTLGYARQAGIRFVG